MASISTQFWADDTKWIWIPDFNDTVDPGQFVLFRRSFNLTQTPSDKCIIHVSADTRYRLYVNGKRASFGPCKSYPTRWFYETVDIAPLLVQGHNVIAAKILRFSYAGNGGLSMMRDLLPGFILHCSVEGQVLSTDENWKAKKDESVELLSGKDWDFRLGPPFLGLTEKVDGRASELGWADANFNDDHWKHAVIHTMKQKMAPLIELRRLTERTIPDLPEVPRSFHSVVTSQGSITKNEWNDFFTKGTPITLAANGTHTVDIQSQSLTTGFIQLHCSAGEGAVIKILSAECYENSMENGEPRTKGDRTDFQNGKLYGMEDTYTTHSGENMYEPFWFRTFRYVRLAISCGSQPLTLKRFDYRETHYPLDIQTQVNSTPENENLWQISLNTIRNCMHETYEDCPFYEQNQFIMDSRSTMLFTYLISRDDRLARKTIHEFHASRREDGLLEAQFPRPRRMLNIPQFSLYFIFMVHDHMRFFGDAQLVKTYMGTIDGILDHFELRINNLGLVGRFEREEWPFVDWVKEWMGKGTFLNWGIPAAYHRTGVATYNCLLYSLTLQHAADLCDYIGRKDTAAEYRSRAEAMNAAVNKHCFNGSLYLDGPDAAPSEVSQHAQIFAVLSGAITGAPAAALMRRTIDPASALPRASFAMSFYLFRAASLVGIYEEVYETLLQPWRKMVAENLTTWAESDNMIRSDCHGWSCSPLHEIVVEVFGVKVLGGGELRIEPRLGLLGEKGKGRFVTGGGCVEVEWEREKGLTVTAEADMAVEIVVRGEAKKREMKAGEPVLVEVV